MFFLHEFFVSALPLSFGFRPSSRLAQAYFFAQFPQVADFETKRPLLSGKCFEAFLCAGIALLSEFDQWLTPGNKSGLFSLLVRDLLIQLTDGELARAPVDRGRGLLPFTFGVSSRTHIRLITRENANVIGAAFSPTGRESERRLKLPLKSCRHLRAQRPARSRYSRDARTVPHRRRRAFLRGRRAARRENSRGTRPA